jgi:hypothetical protein
MAGNPIQYTNRTFNTILNDFNNDTDLADKPEWFKRMIAGVGDLLSVIENASANQSFLRTAFTRRSVTDLLELIDYYLAAQTTSSGTCIFFLNETTSFPATFTATEITALSEGNIAISSKSYEARSGETVNATSGVLTVDAGTDILTVSTDFVLTGHKLRLTTTGTLPAPLAINTDYYAIYISATEIKLATTLENALAGTAIDITTTGTGTHTWNQFSFSKFMYQQEQKEEQVAGESDGVTEWQTFILPDENVLIDNISVRVGVDAYTQVTTFVDSESTDKVYRINQLSDNMFQLLFSDGTYGILPPANTVFATYATGGGSESNITKLNRVNIYSGGNSDITGVFNATTFTGGSDQEDIETGKRIGPLLLKARNRFITTDDGEALAISTGGLSLVKVNKNAYGVLSAEVLGIANGGGNPNSTKRAEVEQFLIDRSLLEEMDIRFPEATLTAYNTSITVTTSSGFVFSDIEPYIILGVKLFWTETGQEILDKFESDTLDNTISLINSIFTTTFSENDDGTEITLLLQSLQRIGARDFGETLQEDDLIAFIRSGVNGIDTMNITAPAFPVVFEDDEISTHTGIVITITEG